MTKNLRKVLRSGIAWFMLVIFTFVLFTDGTVIRAEDGDEDTSGMLVSNEIQQAQAIAMGLPIEQPVRYSPSGKVVNKKESPFGVDNMTYFAVRQVAMSRTGDTDTLQLHYSGADTMTGNRRSETYTGVWKNNAQVTASAAADVDGNGTEEVVTAGIILSGVSLSLHVMVTDFPDDSIKIRNESSTVKDYTIQTNVNFPFPKESALTSKPLQAVGVDLDEDGADEIAILVNKTLYVCEVNLTSASILSTTTFDTSNTYAQINPQMTPAIEIASVDSDGDGFNELLVTTGTTTYKVANRLEIPKLIVYEETDLSSPFAVIDLVEGNRSSFACASIDVGDVFGEGENRIVLTGNGGLGTFAQSLTTIRFNPVTETYDDKLNKVYMLGFLEYQKLKTALPGLKCAALETRKAGDPEYVICGGFVYRYDSYEDKFLKKEVTVSSNNSEKDVNNLGKSLGGITNTNTTKDDYYIMETLAANFNVDTLEKMDKDSGKEQVILLHYNKWYNGEYAYTTVCYIDDDGKLTAKLVEVWEKDGSNAYNYPSICAPDIFNRGLRMKFLPEKSQFLFSDPTVLAVLGATPYYEELFDDYLSIYNVGTSYGSEKSSETSFSNGVTASVGVSIGFNQGISVLGIKVAEVSFLQTLTAAFSFSYSTSKSISQSITYSNYYSEDSVVVMVIPYDAYYFEVYNTQTGSTSEACILIPYSPVTKMMTLTTYNTAAKTIDNAPVIGKEVLGHSIGDPRSYPQELKDLPVSDKKAVLMAGNSNVEDENFVSSGIGNNSITKEITLSSSHGTSYDFSLEYSMSFTATIVGVVAGVNASAGYNFNASVTTTESTTRSGSVASVPPGYSQYEFKWTLVAYNVDLPAGDGTQPCTVITYLVKPIGSYPPKIPGNPSITSRKATGISLAWEKADGAAGYKIYRSDTANGSYILVGTTEGINSTTFTDTTPSVSQACYYQVSAYSSKETKRVSIDTPGLTVTGLEVKTQPRLIYDEGDMLDLSALVLKLTYSDSSTEEVQYTQAPDLFSISKDSGTVLSSYDSGIPINIKFNADNKTCNTNNLTVYAASPYEFSISAVYKVGNIEGATALEAGKTLGATITVKNNTSTSQKGLVVIALYSGKGNLVSVASMTETVDGGATKSVTISNAFTLPSDVSGHYLKVFVWDGSSLTQSSLTPMSNILQF